MMEKPKNSPSHPWHFNNVRGKYKKGMGAISHGKKVYYKNNKQINKFVDWLEKREGELEERIKND